MSGETDVNRSSCISHHKRSDLEMIVDKIKFSQQLFNRVLIFFTISWPFITNLFINLSQQRMQLNI